LLVVLDGDDAAHGEQPGADMALYLARQGVKVEVVILRGDDNDGEQLLSFAADQGSDLVVMGAFGRSRLSEFVMGGYTRTALRTSPVALWMAH
jgi:nucleotide-binding universal stress UspA family protein